MAGIIQEIILHVSNATSERRPGLAAAGRNLNYYVSWIVYDGMRDAQLSRRGSMRGSVYLLLGAAQWAVDKYP